jgi:hypothetical protein
MAGAAKMTTTAPPKSDRQAPSPEQTQAVERAAQLVMDALFNDRQPDTTWLATIAILPQSDLAFVIKSLVTAYNEKGISGVKQAFNALVKDRPWLRELKSKPLPKTDPGAKPDRRIQFKRSAEMKHRPIPSELIFGMLPAQAISLSFGESGTYKSFIVLDWCECISRGWDWLGRNTVKGPIAYIAAEGAAGIGRRLTAWETYHNASDSDSILWFDETLVMQDANNFKELVTALREDFDIPPVLTVIDTLSRCSGGADENSNTEMAKVVAAADAIRQQIGSAVHIIHHAGKDREKGPRGASALIGNMEAIIAFDKTEEGVKLTSFKQKDVEPFSPIYLKPEKVTYGTDPYDNSLVLIPGDPAKPQMKASESVMLRCLVGKELTYTAWVQAGIQAGLLERTAKNAIKGLKDAGQVQQIGRLYSIVTEQKAREDE